MDIKELKKAIKKELSDKVHHITLEVSDKHEVMTIVIVYGKFTIDTLKINAHKSMTKGYTVFSIDGSCTVYTIKQINKALETLNK